MLAHLTDEQFGERQKADDSSGMFCCYACHMAHDQRRTGLDPLALLQLVLRAYQRTVRRLIELKVYPVKLDEPKRSGAGSATAAKRPKSGRKIQSARSIAQRSAWPKGRKIPTRKRTLA